MKRIDTTSVHLWAAAKLTISDAGKDPGLVTAKDAVMKSISKGNAADIGAVLSGIGIGDMVKLGKAVLTLKGAGQEVVQGRRDEGAPLIPPLLDALAVPKEISRLVDRNTDHALLFTTTALLKLDERSPVPVSSEIVLYEGRQTDPSKVKIPGMDALTYSLRAFIYGNNDFCDLAERDAESTRQAVQSLDRFIQGVMLISEGRLQASNKQVKYLPNALRALAAAGPAVCRYKRGDDKAARPWLKSFSDEIRETGIVDDESAAYLDAVYYCGGDKDETAKGKVLIATLSNAATSDEKLERDLLTAYCDASAENRTALGRKISFAAKVTQAVGSAAARSGLIDGLAETRMYTGIMGLAAMTQKAASIGDGTAGAVDAVKGFFKNGPK